MQPTRRWILGAAGLLVAAPSIVRASSLMAMPRAPVVVTPGLWLEFFDRITGKVCRVPCRAQPRDLGHIGFECRVPNTMLAHQVRVGRGYEPAMLTYWPPEGMPLCAGMNVNLGIDVVDPSRPGVADFEVNIRESLLTHLRGGG